VALYSLQLAISAAAAAANDLDIYSSIQITSDSLNVVISSLIAAEKTRRR